jgi:hypothetical protein
VTPPVAPASASIQRTSRQPWSAWWRTEPASARITLVGIAVAAVVARLAALGQPMRYDESITYLYFAGQPWMTAIGDYRWPNNHLLYTVLAKLAVTVGGSAPWVLRLPAFLAGLAIVPLTYAVGRTFYSARAALVGTAATAAATELILFSTNARGYSLVVATCLGLFLVVHRVRTAGDTWGRWAAFASLGAVGLATVPVMLYPLGAVSLWFAVTVWRERGSAGARTLAALQGALAAAGAMAALAYLPIILQSGLGSLTSNQYVTSSPWPVFLRGLLPHLVATWVTWTEPFPAWGVLGIVAATVLVAARRRRARRWRLSPLHAAIVWTAVLLVATRRLPYSRNWLWMLPLAALAFAEVADRALSGLGEPRARRAITGLAWATGVGGVAWGLITNAIGRDPETGAFPAAQAVARALQPLITPTDRIVADVPANAPLEYYLLRLGVDSARFSTPVATAGRELLVVAQRDTQALARAMHDGVMDTSRFGAITRLVHVHGADVYVAVRRHPAPGFYSPLPTGPGRARRSAMPEHVGKSPSVHILPLNRNGSGRDDAGGKQASCRGQPCRPTRHSGIAGISRKGGDADGTRRSPQRHDPARRSSRLDPADSAEKRSRFSHE